MAETADFDFGEMGEYGPLDVVRQRTAEAAHLDVRTRFGFIEDDEKFDVVFKRLKQLDQDHPLFLSLVTVSGRQIEKVYDEDDVGYPLKLDTSNEPGESRGLYNGFNLVEVYDPEIDSPVVRVVHGIQTAQVSDVTPHGHVIEETKLEFVLASNNSEVIPQLPINGHSLFDLAGDPIITDIDRLLTKISPEKLRRLATIKNLGQYVNDMLRHEPGDNGVNGQRASYLNALGLLDETGVITSSTAVLHNDRRQPLNYLATEQRFKFTGGLFDIAPGVRPKQDITEYDLTAAEMFVRGYPTQGHHVAGFDAEILFSVPVGDIKALEYPTS